MVSLVILWACNPDEDDSNLTNNAPVVPNQTFTVPENFPDGQLIGKIQATDKDGDALEFTLLQDESNLFEVNKNGDLFLGSNKKLSYDNQKEHTLGIYVYDGIVGRNGNVTVKVTLPENLAPLADNQSFSASEDFPAGEIIGILEAQDPEGETLIYEIVEDEDGLFELTDDGQLLLAEDQSFDFENKDEHILTISVNDGANAVEITVTITVLDDGDIFDDPASFITTWNVETAGQEIIIGTNSDFDYDYTIDWGDGTQEQRTDHNPSHIYEIAGNYNVAINGQFPALHMIDSDDLSREALIDVVQWGDGLWQSMERAFFQCQNLESFSATDAPELSQVESMFYLFEGATSFNGDIGQWDVSSVTNMSGLFQFANSFNGDISGWNVSNVESMANMFFGATSFNVDLSDWNTENVKVMTQMFYNASSFNQDIGTWSVNNVINMYGMFSNATNFDQNLGSWSITNVTEMAAMFNNSGLTSQTYSAILRGWASQDNIPQGISLGASDKFYCNDFDTAFAREQVLAVDNNWNIGDQGPTACF
jgi:surface protein